MSEHEQSPGGALADAPQPVSEHLNIKVTDGNNEVFFKIKRSTKLEKLMNAFCERQGKQITTVRFLFDGQRVQPGDSPDTVSPMSLCHLALSCCHLVRLSLSWVVAGPSSISCSAHVSSLRI